MTTQPRYPEHEKVKALAGRNQTVGQFIEWLEENGYTICREGEGREFNRYYAACVPITKMIADFFGIDEARLEAEKEQILADFLAAQAEKFKASAGEGAPA